MNIKELEKIFIERGVPEYLYSFKETVRKDERFCVEFTDKKWNVFFTERGVKTRDIYFDTEEEACLFLYNELISEA